MNIGVLASGTGTNLQALIHRVHGVDGVRISAVASDRPGAPALARAQAAKIEHAVFPRDAFASRAARDAAVSVWLRERGVELVVLAGYMQLLSAEFIAAFSGRVINVHPALLPAFPGLHAVQQALDYGVKVFGVTVHFVDEGIDSGPVISQGAVELPGVTDADEVLAALRPVEHELLVGAVQLIARGGVRVEGRRVLIAAGS